MEEEEDDEYYDAENEDPSNPTDKKKEIGNDQKEKAEEVRKDIEEMKGHQRGRRYRGVRYRLKSNPVEEVVYISPQLKFKSRYPEIKNISPDINLGITYINYLILLNRNGKRFESTICA